MLPGAWLLLRSTSAGLVTHLLIGQFVGGGFSENSGTIAAYDLATGRFMGQMKDATGATLSINGLWAISPANGASAEQRRMTLPTHPVSELYFTAGPNQGSGGLFGFLMPVASELTVGNDQ